MPLKPAMEKALFLIIILFSKLEEEKDYDN